MNLKLATCLLVTEAVVLSYLVVIAGIIVPMTFMRNSAARDMVECRLGLSGPTNFMIDYHWIFAGLIVLISLCAIVLIFRFPGQLLRILVLGFSFQGLITWIAFFCFFYDIFLGEMCLHHEPEFDVERFFVLGYGFFPATLTMLLATFYCAFSRQRLRPVVPSKNP